METKESKTYYIGTRQGTYYFDYDEERQTATPRQTGQTVTISPERLADFMHTARLLGMNTGEL